MLVKYLGFYYVKEGEDGYCGMISNFYYGIDELGELFLGIWEVLGKRFNWYLEG